MIVKEYQSWDILQKYLSDIVRQIALDDYVPDVILGPGRGGYPVGVMSVSYTHLTLPTKRIV